MKFIIFGKLVTALEGRICYTKILVVELLRNVFAIFSEKAKAELTKHTVFTEYLKEEDPEENTLQSDLFFDLSHFKANRKVRNTSDNLTLIDRQAKSRSHSWDLYRQKFDARKFSATLYQFVNYLGTSKANTSKLLQLHCYRFAAGLCKIYFVVVFCRCTSRLKQNMCCLYQPMQELNNR